jgi:acetyltransferase-like isoleucine patch superfamily enzyme
MIHSLPFHNLFILLRRIRFFLYLRYRIGGIGSRTFINSPFRLDVHKNLEIGKSTFIQSGLWIYCETNVDSSARIRIGSRCVLGYRNHITAVGSVSIGDDVLTANNVFISDNDHSYSDLDLPIIQQPIKFKKNVSIGSGSWIGENVCIIGASIGRNCVIGANSVVTRDVPDFSVVAGNPAKVIKTIER